MANELIAIFAKVRIPGREWQVLWAVIRGSWSWNRPGCYISNRELAEKTGLHFRHVAQALKSLTEKQIVLTRNGRQKTWVEINLDYMTWNVPEKPSLFSQPKGVRVADPYPIGAGAENGNSMAQGVTENRTFGAENRTPSICLKQIEKKGVKETALDHELLKKLGLTALAEKLQIENGS